MPTGIIDNLADNFLYMIHNLNEIQIDEFLKNQLIGHIGCHAGGITYVVPISYAYDNGYVYAHTHDGMKVDIMRKNPSVCFEVDDTRDTSNWKSVISWGTFEEVHEPAERRKGLQILNNRVLPMVSSETTHLGTAWPFSDDDPEVIEGIIFRIHLTKKTGRYELNEKSPHFSY
jgi:nitroimidazol reductase NimA-like FMN-containing flavoprotein (pyridoxamine 5'-phosphate oxidase superfamily)